MKKIADIFKNPIDRTIEEVIKVDQANEATVRNEIGEYIATDSLRDQFNGIYKEIAAGPSAPREGIGVWISGFFGSGKSLFAKILGYTVANRRVGNTTASELFKKVLADKGVCDSLDLVNKRIPFQAVIFDVSMDRGVRAASDRLTEIMYRALLRELGYVEDFDLAELEITLEGDGTLQKFEEAFKNTHKGEEWKKRRQLGLAINEASAALHELDPKTYPTTESYAHGIGKGRKDITPKTLAKRAFELSARRQPGKALIFIIDEVGQYVSRSVDKMSDLKVIVEAFGVEGKNRTERREAVSPFWIVVTSQEKLNEVVTALDSRRVELARLQDRFRLQVDLKQSDIAEVTSERVLKKKQQAENMLGTMFDEHDARIKQCCTLERTSRNIDIDRSAFIGLYPYLPYQIDLSIDIVSGLRLKRGAQRHVGGSNRTIIKQAQEMMINNRTRLADTLIGTLVTLDKVYELLEAGNLLPSEVEREISRAVQVLNKNELAHKVLKAIALLESVKDLPRTSHNIAVVLHPSVDAQPLIKNVEDALKELEKAQFVRQTDEGYKLLTVQEKNWETKRNGMEPREVDRNKIHRKILSEIYGAPNLRSFRYNNIRSFRTSIKANGETIESEGDISLNIILTAEDEKQDTIESTRDQSVTEGKELFLVSTLSDEIRTLVTELYRSREMISEYDRLGAQQKLTVEETSCLSDEKNRRDRNQRILRDKILACLEGGIAFFEGVSHDVPSLGKNLAEAIRELIVRAVPKLYPKLEIGVLNLSGNEPEKFLVSTNLSGLDQIFYNDQPERSLVIKQGDRFVPNLACDLCREILDYLRREHAYGNRVTGKMLESHFSGIGYAWERESIRLGVAILFRGGAVEVTYQGKKYRNYAEPTSRQPFMITPAFRSSSFAPRESLDLKVLANAARMYEEITGSDVDIEEGAIAQAFKQVAATEREKLMPLSPRLNALQVPGASVVQEQLSLVQGIIDMPPDDCVKLLAGEGKAYLESRRRCSEIEKNATKENINSIEQARRVLNEQFPVLDSRQLEDDLEKAKSELEKHLESEDALEKIEKIRYHSDIIAQAYRTLYEICFEKRKKAYETALEEIKGRPEWVAVVENPDINEDQRDQILFPLTKRALPEMDLPVGATVCRRTHATVAQMESDIEAVESVARQVLHQIIQLVSPQDEKEKIERMSVANLYRGRITNQEELDEFIKTLRERMQKILAQGGTIVLE